MSKGIGGTAGIIVGAARTSKDARRIGCWIEPKTKKHHRFGEDVQIGDVV